MKEHNTAYILPKVLNHSSDPASESRCQFARNTFNCTMSIESAISRLWQSCKPYHPDYSTNTLEENERDSAGAGLVGGKL